MKRVITAVVLVPLVLLLVFLGPFWLITLACALVAELALAEYLTLADEVGAKTQRVVPVILTALFFITAYRRPDLVGPLTGAAVLTLLIVCTFRSPLARMPLDAGLSVLGVLYTGLPLVALALLSQQGNGPSLVVFLLLVVWVGDTAALYAGRAWGRRKLAPAISPGKTRAGSVASLAASVILAALLVSLAASLAGRNITVLSYPGPVWRWLVIAVVLNVSAQVGDLVESALKRAAHVKDSGSLLPGHGGVLDRIDALLIAAPVFWYILLIQQTF